MYATLAVGGAVGVVACRNVVRMAVSLTTCLGAVAGLFLLYGADFVAAAQLLVYVGGTIILLIFGVMLTAASRSVDLLAQDSEAPGAVDNLLAGMFGLALAGLLIATILQIDWSAPATGRAVTAEPIADGSSTVAIGSAMLGLPGEKTTSYLLPFELVSLHLLTVLIGAAYLARASRTVGPESATADPVPANDPLS